ESSVTLYICPYYYCRVYRVVASKTSWMIRRSTTRPPFRWWSNHRSYRIVSPDKEPKRPDRIGKAWIALHTGGLLWVLDSRSDSPEIMNRNKSAGEKQWQAMPKKQKRDGIKKVMTDRKIEERQEEKEASALKWADFRSGGRVFDILGFLNLAESKHTPDA
ncbi:hypothetical protein BZA70DRAFT_271837, partial [Myxozyma melibiosi]